LFNRGALLCSDQFQCIAMGHVVFTYTVYLRYLLAGNIIYKLSPTKEIKAIVAT